MNLPFYIAKRYLVAKKSQNAINVISWISVISVAIGSFALVVVLSAFNGLEGLVESLFESFDSDIRIEVKKGKTFSASTINFEDISSTEGVENYSQVLKEVCVVRYRKQQSIVQLKGVEDSFLKMAQLDSALVDGQLILKKEGINYAICGYGVSSQLGLFLGKGAAENLTIYAPKRGVVSTINPMNSVYRRMIAPAGIFYLSPEYDNKYILVPLRFVQDLLEYDDEITAVEVSVNDRADIERVSKIIQSKIGEDFSVKSRFQFNEIMYKTSKTEKWVTFLILVFILIIAAFNILSSLSMLIIEKKKDITTLKSLGAKNSLIRNVFFLEGMLINLTGAGVGIGLGVIVCLLQEHVGLLRIEGGIVEYYPISLNPIELIYILITVIIIGFLTSWYPVRNLTKV
ncbi:MAG: ABC transporter permease [Flavobacteriales bacterium]|nr:ABC transporter permease [Flavobacteriales bacterium]